MGPGAPRVAGGTPPRAAAPDRALGGAGRGGPGRRGGPPRAGPRTRRPRRRQGGAAPARAARARPCGASSAPPRATRREPLRAELVAGPARSDRSPRRARAAATSAGWSGAAPWATTSASGWPRPTQGRGGAVLVTGLAGVGKSSVLDLAEALARRRGLAHRPRRRLGRRGPLALRPGARGARRPLPPAPGPAGRARRPLPRRAGPRPVGPPGDLVAVRAPTSGSSSPRPSCCGSVPPAAGCCWSSTTSTRPTRRRCGCCTTWRAAPRPTRCCWCWPHRPDHNAALRGGRTPAWSRAGSGPASTSRRSTRRPPGGCWPSASPTSTRPPRADLGGQRRAAVHAPSSSARQRRRRRAATSPCPACPPDALRALQRAALLGSVVHHRRVPRRGGRRRGRGLPAPRGRARASLVIEWAESGYQFRHALVRDAVLDTCLRPRRASREGRGGRAAGRPGRRPGPDRAPVPRRGPPACRRSPTCCPASRPPARWAPTATPSTWSTRCVDHATGEDRAHLLARRGDLLTALGDPAARRGYRAAVPLTTGTEHRLVRARLARAACFQGDFDTARSALAGLELLG